MDKPTDGQDPFPTPVSNPSGPSDSRDRGGMQGSGFTALGRATEDGVAGGVDIRTGQGKEKKMGHSGQISLRPLPSTWVHTHTQHTSASDAQTRGDAKAPIWVLPQSSKEKLEPPPSLVLSGRGTPAWGWGRGSEGVSGMAVGGGIKWSDSSFTPAMRYVWTLTGGSVPGNLDGTTIL